MSLSRTALLSIASIVFSTLLVGGHDASVALAAETADIVPMTKTVLTLKVTTPETPVVRSRFQGRAASILLEFPGQRVSGWLPDDLSHVGGVVERIIPNYGGHVKGSQPAIRSLTILLSGSYAHRVRTEPGRVIVEIDHPASVAGHAMEIGLKSRRATGQDLAAQRLERFHAMQQALASVTPTPWMLSIQPEAGAATHVPARVDVATAPKPPVAMRPLSRPVPQARAAGRAATLRPAARVPGIWWGGLTLGILALAGIGLWGFRNHRELLAWWRPAAMAMGRVPSGMMLIDQLVWQALEHQGYSLLAEHELTPSPGGPLRIAVKDGVKTGALFAGQGPFFEKQTVEQFIAALSAAGVEQGMLMASGAFTVPAQRVAKEHHITLIGRDQLIELLGAGARSEHVAKQLESQQLQLDESKATLKQYADELDDLRRQRNEASWLLGEERARAGAFEQELGVLRQEILLFQAEMERLGHATAMLKKQWDESQWYLGESRAKAQHLEGQMGVLQESMKRYAEVERQRDEAMQHLAEERTARESLEQHAADLTRQFDEAAEARERLEEEMRRLSDEMTALREYGERREAVRGSLESIQVELWNEGTEPLYRGVPRDISRHGIGLVTDGAIHADHPLRTRLFLPGLSEPLETTAELRWQQAAGEGSWHGSGYRLSGLTERAEDAIDLLLGHDAPPAP